MKLFNSLLNRRGLQDFQPLNQDSVSIYSCGPTVYNNLTIGNLLSFIFADTLRRAVVANFPNSAIKHVMNITDVDDKTIRGSQNSKPSSDPLEALKQFTAQYEEVFLRDITALGIDVDKIQLVRATDSIAAMQDIIRELLAKEVAYLADDSIYFSIEKYRALGKVYGQLSRIDSVSTSQARINNDEYDKDSAHDFALWKLQADGEPAWDFIIDGQNHAGRPGWHIECSAMARVSLGQPFDIHTGGIDLKFPHHENEIAQSTASAEDDRLANFFVHNEHLLVNGTKMSKSLNNFYTLRDIEQKGMPVLAFRLLALQSHYQNQLNFSWESLQAASNALKNIEAWADLVWQNADLKTASAGEVSGLIKQLKNRLSDNLDTPGLLADLFGFIADMAPTKELLVELDKLLGLRLSTRADIDENIKKTLAERGGARAGKNWNESDRLRDQLAQQGISVRDTEQGQIWSRL